MSFIRAPKLGGLLVASLFFLGGGGGEVVVSCVFATLRLTVVLFLRGSELSQATLPSTIDSPMELQTEAYSGVIRRRSRCAFWDFRA